MLPESSPDGEIVGQRETVGRAHLSLEPEEERVITLAISIPPSYPSGTYTIGSIWCLGGRNYLERAVTVRRAGLLSVLE